MNVTRSTSQAEPHWTKYDASVRPQALILMLHGGKDRSQDVVDSRSLSWRRSASMQRDIARRAQEAGASVWLLRFTRRGWNGGADRIADARTALDDVRRRLGDVPVVLLGHSMGGRTALSVSDDDDVRLVLGLAPWIERGDPTPRDGQKTVLIHGDRDVITPLSASRLTVDAMLAAGEDATLIRVARGEHAMVVRAGLWTALVVDIVAATFVRELGGSPEPRSGPIGAVVARAVHGGGGVMDI